MAHKKGGIEQEIEKANRAIDIMGGKFVRTEKMDIEELGEKRCLVIVEKVHPTPDKYPRRSGIPTKRPISDV